MVANFEYFATNFIEFSILLEEYEIIKYGGGDIIPFIQLEGSWH